MDSVHQEEPPTEVSSHTMPHLSMPLSPPLQKPWFPLSTEGLRPALSNQNCTIGYFFFLKQTYLRTWAGTSTIKGSLPFVSVKWCKSPPKCVLLGLQLLLLKSMLIVYYCLKLILIYSSNPCISYTPLDPGTSCRNLPCYKAGTKGRAEEGKERNNQVTLKLTAEKQGSAPLSEGGRR